MAEPLDVYETLRCARDEVSAVTFCLMTLTAVAGVEDTATAEALETCQLTNLDATQLGAYLESKFNRLRLEANRLERLVASADFSDLASRLAGSHR